jgi:hypothetical protein
MLTAKPRSVNPYCNHRFDEAGGPTLPTPRVPNPRQQRLLALLDPLGRERLIHVWQQIGLIAESEAADE